MRKYNKTTILAWLVGGVTTIAAILKLVSDLLAHGAQQNVLQLVATISWGILPILFSIVGVLIVSRQQRNLIGWLLMLPLPALLLDVVTGNLIRNTPVPSLHPPVSLLIAVWFSNSIWLLLIFPLIFIALLFPNGSPPSIRWRWVALYGLGLVAFFVVVAAFAQTVGPDPTAYGVNWTIPNPIGFIPDDIVSALLFPWWVIALGAFTILALVSLIVRYRRAAVLEREQIKWLLYASGLFALVYVPGLVTGGNSVGVVADITNLGLSLVVFGFPLAIGIAILRYRLFDIDILIRRTLTYALVAGLLLVVYFGSIVFLQQIFANLTGTNGSELVTVLSTLAIAALFVPLRNRIQAEIDRRFNRNKYDAQRVLSEFANTVRDETDLGKLTARLIEVVDETMQPKSVSVWLKKDTSRRGNK